jgi:3-oxoacyl-[acyl-carrier protein] reductase
MTVFPSPQPGLQELAGKVALVTGAARNIGRAIAIELAGAGAAVLVAARTSRQDVEQTRDLLRASGGRAEFALADLGQPGGAAQVVDACIAAFGRLDIVVANAALRSDAPIESIGAEEWRRVVSSILDATFFCAQAAAPHLRRSGGAFIGLGGVAAHTGIAGRTHVSAAKAGVVGLIHSLAAEWAPDGITVNCVSPSDTTLCRGISGTDPCHSVGPAHPRKWPPPCAFSQGQAAGSSPARSCTSTAVGTWAGEASGLNRPSFKRPSTDKLFGKTLSVRD